jgi:signal transduction histidine kinase/ActR/RegA family two-component response regulator
VDNPSEFLEHLPGIAAIQDASGRYVWISAATPPGWLGKLDIEVQPPQLSASIIAHHDAFLGGALTPTQEVRVIGTTQVRFRVQRFALPDERVGLHGVDITEDHEATARRAVSDRLASVAAISSGIAHEINNPLSWVLGNLDFAQREVEQWRGTPSPEALRDVRESVVEALDGANRMRRVIRELRTFSHREPATDLVDLRRIITSAIQVAGREVRATAELTTDLGRAPMIRADASLVGQVLVNLLGNAAEAFEDNRRGVVKVVLCTSASGGAQLEVIDNGCGIPPEKLESIFHPFFTTKRGGTGLGLAICQHVVHLFGGSIYVRSKVGKGTRFVIELPAGRKPTLMNPKLTGQFARGDTSVLTRQPGTLNLMVIDDEPFIGSLLERMLDEHQVAVFQTGQDALADLRVGGDYDVILCDLMMHEMNGMEVFAAIRDEFPALAPRVVFMTGGAYTPDAQEFLDGADNTCIPKPFDIRVLRSTVQRIASAQ